MVSQHKELAFSVLPQPDGTTCGPTCLQAVYSYFGRRLPLRRVISEVKCLPEGGTLAVSLACHALKRGFRAVIYTYNLQIFDPTWFQKGRRTDLVERLQAQRKLKRGKKLGVATDGYLEFLRLGGVLHLEELRGRLLRRFLNRGIPILTGLSATYLYRCSREHEDDYDDLRGQPVGHFVVLSGYDTESREVVVADPLHDNPAFERSRYRVGMDRLIASILLGVITYDANLLMIAPPELGLGESIRSERGAP